MKIAGSLYTASSAGGVIVNRNAMHKGDVLTIVVSEATNGTQSASTTATKTDSTTVSPLSLPAVTAVTNQFLNGLLQNIANGALAGGSTGATSSMAGAGTATAASAFTTNISVVVKDVTPNGNLIIEGRRTFRMNKQTQTLILQGIVRRDDVSITNTVLSQQVADLRLLADGKGLIADRQREGLLTRLLSWVF